MANIKIRFAQSKNEIERVSELVNNLQIHQKMKECPRLPTGKNLIDELTRTDDNGKFHSNNNGTFVAVADDEESRSSEIEQSKIVGYLIYSQSFNIMRGRHFYINSFFIEQNYRGHGLGRKFIGFLERHAKLVGAEGFDVPVMNDNVAGHRFYKRFGSYPVNEDYYIVGQELDAFESFLK